MDSRLRLYVAGAFMLGVALTLGYKDVYPDLERRFRQGRRRASTYVESKVASSLNQEVVLKDNSQDLASSLPDGEIREGIEGCIGNTPLLKIRSLSQATGCEILAKAEFLNAAGNSPKDRVALNVIRMAEEEGLLKPHSGDMIYEGTVGSTGNQRHVYHSYVRFHSTDMEYHWLLFAEQEATLHTWHHQYKPLIWAARCMPDDQATEKSDLLLKLGAEVERVRPASIVDQNQFVNMARNRAAEHTTDPNRRGRGIFADQFETEANWQAHFSGTGPEIYNQTGGRLDAFVAGAGTGGTISGVALFLKPRLPELKVVLADPQGSGLYNRVKFGVMFDPKEREGTRRRHQVDTIVEGVGINRVTNNFEAGRELVDDAIRVTDEQAMAMARWLVEKDGIFIGSSSALNCVAATKVAQQLGPGHRVVTILCDSGARHLSKFWARTGAISGKEDTTLEDVLNS